MGGGGGGGGGGVLEYNQCGIHFLEVHHHAQFGLHPLHIQSLYGKNDPDIYSPIMSLYIEEKSSLAFCRFGLLEAVYLLSTVTRAQSFVSPVSSSEIIFNLPPRIKAEVLSIDTSALSKQTLDPVMYHRCGCQFRQIKKSVLDWKLRATSKSQFMYVKSCFDTLV